MLEAVALQLAAVAGMHLATWGLRAITRSLLARGSAALLDLADGSGAHLHLPLFFSFDGCCWPALRGSGLVAGLGIVADLTAL